MLSTNAIWWIGFCSSFSYLGRGKQRHTLRAWSTPHHWAPPLLPQPREEPTGEERGQEEEEGRPRRTYYSTLQYMLSHQHSPITNRDVARAHMHVHTDVPHVLASSPPATSRRMEGPIQQTLGWTSEGKIVGPARKPPRTYARALSASPDLNLIRRSVSQSSATRELVTVHISVLLVLASERDCDTSLSTIVVDHRFNPQNDIGRFQFPRVVAVVLRTYSLRFKI
jgi:hypothetical protein